MDILFLQVLADVEASAYIAAVAFLADIFNGFLLGFSVLLGSICFCGRCILLILLRHIFRCNFFRTADGQIAIFQLNLKFVFLKSRQVDGNFIILIGFLDIRLHQLGRGSTIQSLVKAREGKIHPVIKVIKYTIIKNARHIHKSSLLFVLS